MTTATAKHWLDPSLQIQTPAGVLLPLRGTLQFVDVTPTDDEANDRTIVPGGGGTSLPKTRVRRSIGVPGTLADDDDLVEVTGAAAQTLPAAPIADGVEYEICNNTAGDNDVHGGGHNINVTGTGTMTLGPRQSVTFTWSLGSTEWLAS